MRVARKRNYINDGWKFSHVFKDAMIDADYDDSAMEEVRLPHTNRELPYNYCNENDYQEVCCYRKKLLVSENDEGAALDLTFMGVGHVAEVYVNGEFCVEHRTGYTAFSCDISKVVKYGAENVICVKVDTRETLNVPPFGKVIDYMTYGGIYRDVYIEKHDRDSIKDVFVSTSKVNKKGAICELLVEFDGFSLDADSETDSETLIERKIRICADGPVFNCTEFEVLSGVIKAELKVKNIELWSVENPKLYNFTVNYYVDGMLADSRTVKVGFRTAEFRADGFYLNNEKVKLRGMDHHQSYPYVGYAMPKSMQVMDADIMKNELSLNAVRTSHYPQSHDFIDRCDEIGILVFTEFPGWQHIGDSEWKDQAVVNVKEMVCQYRNHPSIILWGVRINESQDDDEFYERTNKAARELDPSRSTGGVRNFGKSHLLEDVYTYNDFVHTGDNQGVDSKKKITPDMKKGYLVSEYLGHMFPTKAFDCEEHRLSHALRHARVIDDVAGYEDIAGSFGWCMFDYNTHKDFGSGDRICYHGIMDMFRNPKMAAFVYESQKKPENAEDVVLQISSSMDIGEHPAGNLGDVYAFTNADSVRLYKNDKFIAEFTRENTAYKNIPYGPILINDFIGNQIMEEEGYDEKKAKEIKLLLLDVAKYGMASLPPQAKMRAAKLMAFYKMSYDDGVNLFGKYIGNWGGHVTTYRFDAIYNGEVARSVVKGPAETLKFSCVADHTELKEDKSYDVAAIRIRVTDQNDNIAVYCNEPVKISVSGPAKLIGPDIISVKGGMGGLYIKTTGESGEITVTLCNPQIGEEKLSFSVE